MEFDDVEYRGTIYWWTEHFGIEYVLDKGAYAPQHSESRMILSQHGESHHSKAGVIQV